MAGVRFCKLRENVSPGDRVVINSDVFQDSICYPILTTNNKPIGYVPRSLVSELSKSQILDAYVSAVDQHAVPWKRFEVTVVSKVLA